MPDDHGVVCGDSRRLGNRRAGHVNHVILRYQKIRTIYSHLQTENRHQNRRHMVDLVDYCIFRRIH